MVNIQKVFNKYLKNKRNGQANIYMVYIYIHTTFSKVEMYSEVFFQRSEIYEMKMKSLSGIFPYNEIFCSMPNAICCQIHLSVLTTVFL